MSRKTRARWWCGALVVLVALGCSDDDSDGSGDSEGASAKDQFISKLCAEFSSCCAAEGRPADGAQCRAFYGAFTPSTGFDETAAEACLEEIRASSDKCAVSSGRSCSLVFASAGTKQPGEACEEDDECAAPESGEVECAVEFVDGATMRQCQVRLPGKAGSSPCVGTVDGNATFSTVVEGIPSTGYLCDVADGLACDSQTGACESLAEVGEPCSGGLYQCVKSAYCDAVAGSCKARLATGQACTRDAECEEGAYCDPDASLCAQAREVGAACMTNAECRSDDCTNQKCAATNDLTLTFLCGED